MSNLSIQPPDSLYKRLQILAKQDGVSLDQFIALAVAEKISALTTEGYLQERASQGNPSKYESVLAKVADIKSDPRDQLPSA
ncbi:MAG: toxin-antitoxin system HicB family antitoxin [Cyanobacteria bacterium P01_C01_bin.70]